MISVHNTPICLPPEPSPYSDSMNVVSRKTCRAADKLDSIRFKFGGGFS